MSRKSSAARREEPATLPDVLIPPGDAEESERAAYWIDLLSDIGKLKAATETTDFFMLMQEFPGAVWDRLSIYLYRLPDDQGMLIKNSDDKPHYIKVLRQPLTEEFVSKNWGGGKYQVYLKIDNKEVLRKHTFRIDGEPKLQPGQRIEIEGKSVPIGGASGAPAETRSDLATVIEASASANKQNMEILAEGSKAAIQLVRDQASAASKPDAQSGLMDKLMTAMIDRMMNPPAPPPVADPIDTFVKLQTLMKNPAVEAPEPKDPPIAAAMKLVEDMSGGRTFAELIKGRGPVAPDSPWAPFAPVALQFVTSLPTLVLGIPPQPTARYAGPRLGLPPRNLAPHRQARRNPAARTARGESHSAAPYSPARKYCSAAARRPTRRHATRRHYRTNGLPRLRLQPLQRRRNRGSDRIQSGETDRSDRYGRASVRRLADHRHGGRQPAAQAAQRSRSLASLPGRFHAIHGGALRSGRRRRGY